MKAKEKEAVYNKYNGHCAYCGKELGRLANLRVDHATPIGKDSSFGFLQSKLNSIDNLMPACNHCNIYKGQLNIEDFRFKMFRLHKVIKSIFAVKIAIDFGIITLPDWSGKFYFEKVEK